MRDIFGPDDRFIKIRIGKIVSIYTKGDDKRAPGELDVLWLDGEPGGQSRIPFLYPCFSVYQTDSEKNNWGIECGYDVGMIGVFGFLKDNLAILLGTVLPSVKQDQNTNEYTTNTGYNLTDKIQPGEFRITSKTGARIYLDSIGGIRISTGKVTLRLWENGNLTVDTDGYVDIGAKGILLGGGEKRLVVTDAAPGEPIVDVSQLQASNKISGI
jgi:hypothetical protein